MNISNKPVYELYHPHWYDDQREYIVIVHKDGKRYGYEKRHREQARYRQNPQTGGMKFVGYMKEKAFEEMVFVDLL